MASDGCKSRQKRPRIGRKRMLVKNAGMIPFAGCERPDSVFLPHRGNRGFR